MRYSPTPNITNQHTNIVWNYTCLEQRPPPEGCPVFLLSRLRYNPRQLLVYIWHFLLSCFLVLSIPTEPSSLASQPFIPIFDADVHISLVTTPCLFYTLTCLLRPWHSWLGKQIVKSTVNIRCNKSCLFCSLETTLCLRFNWNTVEF